MDTKNILAGLSSQDKRELYSALVAELQPSKQFLEQKFELNKETVLNCPTCKNVRIHGHGSYRGRSRYKCVGCTKTFNDFTDPSISGIKKTQEFQEYIKIVGETTIRKAAGELTVNIKTIFD